jgi:predicted metalloendopeptidase
MKTHKEFNFYAKFNNQWVKTQKLQRYESNVSHFSKLDTKIRNEMLKESNAKVIMLKQFFQNNDAATIRHIFQLKTTFPLHNIADMFTFCRINGIPFPMCVAYTNDSKNPRVQTIIISDSSDYKVRNKSIINYPDRFHVFLNDLFSIAYGKTHRHDLKSIIQIINPIENTYHKYNRTDFFKEFEFDLSHNVIVENPPMLKTLVQIFKEHDTESYIAYLAVLSCSLFHVSLRKCCFEYFDKLVKGTREQMPFKLQVFDLLRNGILNIEISKRYLRLHPHKRERKYCRSLVDALVNKLIEILDKNKFLHKKTIHAAKEKIRRVKFVIGESHRFKRSFLEEWNPSLNQTPFELLTLFNEYNLEKDMSKLKKTYVDEPITDVWDQSKCGSVYDVNAYYLANENTIVIPNGILQSPFIEPDNSLAYNLGIMGTTIGHELFHAVDEEGSKFDSDGNYRNWWFAADMKAYKTQQRHVVKQYEMYAMETDGIKIDGTMSLGENLSDIGGFLLSEMILLDDIKSKDNKSRDSILKTFYEAYVKQWMIKINKKESKLRMTIDEHASYKYRTNCVLVHSSEFRRIYGIKYFLSPFFWSPTS